MTTESIRPAVNKTVAQEERPPFSRRLLKLENPANIGPLVHIALWLGLALYLTAPRMGYGTDTVGYLAAIAAVSIVSTPRDMRSTRSSWV